MQGRPRFSIVTAVHNVQRYLAEFIDSIDQQNFDLDQLQIVAVDDGSTDDSLAVLNAWAERRPGSVTVLTKENGGQGSARNLGLEHVTGEWVTFTDPDDILDPEYFGTVDHFLRANPSTMMVGTNRLLYMEKTGRIVDTHPMRRMWAGGDQLIDLRVFPEYAQNSAATGFFRAELIEREKLRFDARIRPIFEDGHFCISYLLAADEPLVAFLQSARYIYRRREDGTSTLQTSVQNPDRFLAVPKYGYLHVLDRAAGPDGYAPEWLQNMVLYDISYYFSADLVMSGGTAARGDVAVQFLELLRQIANRIDPDVLTGYRFKRFDLVWRDIMLHSLDGEPWVTPYVVVTDRDRRRKQVKIAYRFVGKPPEETILVGGEVVRPAHGKIFSHVYFEQPLMNERVAWVPADDTFRVLLDGKPAPLLPDWPQPGATSMQPDRLDRWMRSLPDHVPPKALRRPTKVVRSLSRTWPVRRMFAGSWALMDRIHDADDNAERLFRYLRDQRRDVNAWFVLERGTPDWKRLKRDGHGRRLIPYGGVLWRFLMLNCSHLISSHADTPVHRPPAITRMKAQPQWKFTFLQHGVIKDDLSRWLNPKEFALFVTSTPQEQESIAGDDNHYVYTSKEAVMTGLPRFDRLLELGSRVPVEDRKWLLVCPTWRYWLAPPLVTGSQRREVKDEFFESDFARQWMAFLTDDRLRRLAEENGLRIGFLPHPNLQPALPRMSLPSHVQALTFAGEDVQQVMADAALMVTDYSSMAFNAAYLDRPVVYFQFDAERLSDGAHVGRPGYFQYERDGFGPVTRTVRETVDAVVTAVSTDAKVPAAVYQERIDATFTERDGRCCERTTAAIENI